MKFKVLYTVGKVKKFKIINSTFETCESDALKVSKKWEDIILVDKTKGQIDY